MASASGKLQNQLQSAVQSLRWTYSLYWRLCHEQGILVWGDGYYNGSIKTRKTVQPVEVSTEEASLQRSQQLWELYEFLSAGLETAAQPAQPARRPCAALSPEDLTESEWFYLMCVSFSFPPGTGLPGKAFAEKRHVWMTRANEGDSKYFPRAILAKSAGIKTVLCIPLEDGVLELGSTEKVEEDTGLVRKARSFFAEQQEAFSMHRHHPPKPALSEHSTSDAFRGSMFHSPPLAMIHLPRIESLETNQKINERDDDEDQDDDEEEEDEEEGGGFGPHVGAARDEACDAIATTINDSVEKPTEASGLMQMEMSSDVRLGSPDDCSSNFSMDLPALAPLELDPNMVAGRASADKELKQTPGFHHPWASSLEAEQSATPFTESTQEDAHYSHTVSTIMQHNANQMSESCCVGHLNWSSQSAFSGWSRIRAGDGRRQPVVASQYQLKYILFTLPFVYDRNGKVDGEGYEHRFPRFTSQDDLSASHVLAERRRREKLNERFVVLRSLVPFVTKMDKASILGDTIEYVKQLRRRIQELESGAKPVTAVEQRPKAPGTTKPPPATQANSAQAISPERSRFITAADRRKARALEGGASMAGGVDGSSNYLEVSIIEADALLELQCPYREGLLLKIMQRLQELRIETTSVQSSSTIDDLFVAELRAKVKEDMHGKKASIIDVKKVIYHIFSSY